MATSPSRMSAFSRERDRSSMRAASTRSSRSPASSAAITTVSCRPASIMSDPSATDDEKPLDPAAARIVAKVRWLMLISGFATVLGIAVVIGVVGYRVFRSEGSAQADVTALLPKGARVVSSVVAEDRIVLTLDVGGAT